MTNTHVVANGVEVSVTMPDKRELRAKIVGVDEATDIAVLKIDAGNLPTLAWGDSSKLRVAEWVLAIGNPFQLNQTVTLGIVSATGRSLEGRLASYEDFIQTDAAINPGNSGGALVSARGELVGINTAIFSDTGGYQGIGFAVPSNLARHVMDDLISYGAVQRGTIQGIELQSLTTQLAEQLGAPNTQGAVVVRMIQRSEAYAAGIRPGDIVTSFNTTAIDDGQQLLAAGLRREDRHDRDARPAAGRQAALGQGPDREIDPSGTAALQIAVTRRASRPTPRRCRPRRTATPAPRRP